MFQLLPGFQQVHLRLLQLTNVGGSDVIAIHLDRRPNFGVEIDYLCLQSLLVLGQKFFRGHHLSNGIVQLRHAVAHVADRLLKDEFGVLGLLDDATEQRAHRALNSAPQSHFPSLLWPI